MIMHLLHVPIVYSIGVSRVYTCTRVYVGGHTAFALKMAVWSITCTVMRQYALRTHNWPKLVNSCRTSIVSHPLTPQCCNMHAINPPMPHHHVCSTTLLVQINECSAVYSVLQSPSSFAARSQLPSNGRSFPLDVASSFSNISPQHPISLPVSSPSPSPRHHLLYASNRPPSTAPPSLLRPPDNACSNPSPSRTGPTPRCLPSSRPHHPYTLGRNPHTLPHLPSCRSSRRCSNSHQPCRFVHRNLLHRTPPLDLPPSAPCCPPTARLDLGCV